ncbi:MAG: lipid IV(A) 3-deoxy-D-manno-octulosonic acid transferase [Gallionella sp.]|nr:lipid IV(A) 3-deoxy-D-manno-octulosonic acid transferase [Gallionella sp.]
MNMPDSRFAYTALLWLLLPYVFFHLLWRGIRQREYLRHIGERFGRYTVRSDQPVIWLHTVSVGETRAAAALVQRLRECYSDHRILLTHTTPTGRAASEQLYGDKVLRVYLPYDYPFATRCFLRHFRPCLGILLETEVWFNLIHQCHAEAIPLLLLNARLSERSARGYARFPALADEALRKLSRVAAQTAEDARRLASLGAQEVVVMGNLKFDIEPPAAMLQSGQALRASFGTQRPVFLAASTREGEEALLLAGLTQNQAIVNSDDISRSKPLLVVIVPRHPQRFNEVAALIGQHGFRWQRRSANEAIAPDTQIVLGDSMGEMFAYYAACDLAFIGGSLLPFGGQNLIEACAVGKPVLIGPHTYNFAQATEQALACGAATRIADAGELVQQLEALLHDPARLEHMGQAGIAFVNDNRGATGRAMTLVEAVYPCRSGFIPTDFSGLSD